MEPFVDFGLLELLGILALTGVSPAARRRVLHGLRTGRAKLGRCVRCMTVTAIGLTASSVAVVWLGPELHPLVRVPLYATALGFGVLALLHLSAIAYRALARLETRVARISGGCKCTAASSRRTDAEIFNR
jgi:hypothetical protein